jgi:hypothetical protein
MRLLLVIALALVAAPGLARAVQRPVSERGPWLLASLPEMGAVTWRCDPARTGVRAYALGFRGSAAAATELVALRVENRVVLVRTIEPCQSLRLPHVSAVVQRLTVVQTTEPGTLRGTVSVDFAPRPVSPSHCFPWLPPAVTVHVYPR